MVAKVLFYLDYVGCKVGAKTKGRQGGIRFYLDYVGCKEVTRGT